VHQGISHRIWTQTLESKNNNFNNSKYYIHPSHQRYRRIKDINNHRIFKRDKQYAL